jgi:hypothetical protein
MPHLLSDETAADQPREPLGEERKVLAWRYQQVRQLGFARLEARLLAESDAELALLRKLMRAGCSAALAFDIVV